MQLIIGLALGLTLFLCTIKAYTIGLKHGRELSKGNIPKVEVPTPSPLRAILDARSESKKPVDKMEQGLMNLLAYDGNPQKEVN